MQIYARTFYFHWSDWLIRDLVISLLISRWTQNLSMCYDLRSRRKNCNVQVFKTMQGVHGCVSPLLLWDYCYSKFGDFAFTIQPATHERMMLTGRMGQPSHHAIYLASTYVQILTVIRERTNAPKPDTKTPKNQQVEKTGNVYSRPRQ